MRCEGKETKEVTCFNVSIYKFIHEVFNMNLFIDKSMYFTIVIGQITVYGIMLTFYQFVVSYQDPENMITSYLGENITEYLNKKELKAYKKIISRKIFSAFFMLEILYKPFLVVFGDWVSNNVIKILNFIWFGFVIFYFLIFVILFFECTKVVFKLKMSLDVKKNNEVMNDIEHMFLKKTLRVRLMQLPVNLLRRDFNNLAKAIENDNNSKLKPIYDDVIQRILYEYTAKKEWEIRKIKNERWMPKHQIPWLYTAEQETGVFRNIVEGKYVTIDENNAVGLFDICLKFIELNIMRAQKDGVEQLDYDVHSRYSNFQNDKTFDVSEWVKISVNLFEKIPDGAKGVRADKLYKLGKDDSCLFRLCCKRIFHSLMENEIDAVYTGKLETTVFLSTFGNILDGRDEDVNHFYSERIKEWILFNSKIDDGDMLDKLHENNASFLLVYIVVYYSIYKFREEWEYINLNTMNVLWKQHGKLELYTEEVVQRIEASHIGHRFNKEMYYKLMEYIHVRMSNNLLKQINIDGKLDMFYVWIMKVCVVDKDDYVYSFYNDNYDVDTQIAIVNELSQHNELVKDDQVIKWINYMRFNTFSKMAELPQNLNITLKNLLLTNINGNVFVDDIEKNYWIGSKDIGAYLLFKLNELPRNIKRREEIVETIKSAFVISNMSVEEYVNKLENEGEICNNNINYVQKEEMRRYLASIL